MTENDFVGVITFNMIRQTILLCKSFRANFTPENKVFENQKGRKNS